jgi:hypothetical protein
MFGGAGKVEGLFNVGGFVIVVKKVFPFQGFDEAGRGLAWKRQTRGSIVGVRCEGVGARLKHQLGKFQVVGERSDEVAQHGIRLPMAEEMDDVGVHIGAEEGGGAPGAEAAWC